MTQMDGAILRLFHNNNGLSACTNHPKFGIQLNNMKQNLSFYNLYTAVTLK